MKVLQTLGLCVRYSKDIRVYVNKTEVGGDGNAKTNE